MTDKILVEITDDCGLFSLREEFLNELKKELIYHRWKMENDKYRTNEI